MTPNSIQEVYASEVISTFDIDKPEVLNALFESKGDQGLGFFRISESIGFKTPVAQDTYRHYEENWRHETFHALNAVPAPGPGNNLVVTLSPSDLDANNAFYPRQWFIAMTKNRVVGSIIDINTAVPSAPVLTIRPSEVTDDFGAVAAGEEIIIASSAFSEGSGQPGGVVTGAYKYTNDLQIIKETLEATGTEMTNQKWFKVVKPSGKNITAYYLKGQMDTDYRMNLAIDGALLFGKRTTNTTTDTTTNRPIKTTEGLVPWLERLGQQINYVPGLYSVQKFDQMAKVLDKQFAGKNILVMPGIDLNIEIENTLVDYFKDTNINYVTERATKQLFGGNKGLAMSVGFKYLMKAQRTFAFKQMGVFSHPKLYGADGFKTPGLGVVLPIGRRKDKLTQNMIPTFGCRYKKLGNYSRMMEVWNVSGAGPGLKVTQFDTHNHFLRCHMGFHGIAGNQGILLNPQ